MKKVILVDGNNLMFRAYFATSYSGNIMRNSEGFPTNALYGFVNMLNKIIAEEKPEYITVAFDVGKNFRKKEYDFYKEGRSATPEELKMQMPYARKILDGMGIKYLELEPYEADDIIGTLVKMAEEDKDYKTTIISSDKDLLQLINFETDVKLLKKDSHIRYTEKIFEEEYKIKPIKMIDLKALMGDSSDNIPGVKGIGEKTALKLLEEHGSLEGVYENIDKIKGATKDKLVVDKENAFISKKLATIYTKVPLDITFEDLKYMESNEELIKIYEELGFNSFIRKLKENVITEVDYEIINDLSKLNLSDEIFINIELDNQNYHYSSPICLAITDKNGSYIIEKDNIKNIESYLKDKKVATYDIKKHLYFLNLNYTNDLMISAFLLSPSAPDDLGTFASSNGEMIATFEELKKEKFDSKKVYNTAVLKSKFIYNNVFKHSALMAKGDEKAIYNMIDLPLTFVLSDMEKMGIKCLKDILNIQGEELDKEINDLTKDIHELAGCEFNISSPKQLGEILFDKLELGKGNKNKTGYKTDASTLEKLLGKHPIIEKILMYRNLTKLKSTYIDGLTQYINENSIIKPIFKQTLARTGRLSCVEPNLQNIPIRKAQGNLIRKAFVPQNDLFLAADYSQIELRILAHISKDDTLIKAFNDDADIHKKVAADIYGKKEEDVTKEERKTAKAVIFGIVYGISGFGLGESLKISSKEASDFIQKYFQLYPKVKEYMDHIVAHAIKFGNVRTFFNRVRVIDEIKSSNFLVRQMGHRMALNTPIQGTSADIIKIAMINISKDLKENNLKSKLILQIHDELILDIVKSEEEIVTKIVRDRMENAIKLLVPLKVEIRVASNWFEV